MKLFSSLVLVCLSAAAQEPGKPAPEPGTVIKEVDLGKSLSNQLATQMAPLSLSPERVIATVDGIKITAGDLFQFYQTLPENMQFYYGQNPKEFVERFALVRKFAMTAVARKLDQQEPYRHQLEFARDNILMQAAMDEFNQKNVVKEEDLQKYYREHQDEFTQAGVSGIFIGAYSDNAKRAADIHKRLKAGADFGKLAKAESTDRLSAEKNGSIGYLDKTGNYPAEAMKVILALKPGEISEPLAMDTGFWIFRLDEIRVKEYASVKDQLAPTLKQQALLKWIESTRKALTVTVQDETYFKTEPLKLIPPEATPAAK